MSTLNEIKALSGEMTAWRYPIRTYYFNPHHLVTDHRTGHETPGLTEILDGGLDALIDSCLLLGLEPEEKPTPGVYPAEPD